MTRSRTSVSLIAALSAAAGAAVAIACVVVWIVCFRPDVAVGPVVIRSQRGLTYPLPVPAEGIFPAPSPAPPPVPAAGQETPRNVVLVIGDGMGLGMVSSASALLHGPAGGLALETSTKIGLMRVFAADALVTDSAAAASAMATGYKTNRAMVSTLPDGRRPATLFERARARGMATGVVTTSGLMDATPAGFSVHNVHRNSYAEILADQLSSGTDVMIGAAWGLLDHLDHMPELAAALAQARERGVTIVTAGDQLDAARAPFVALFPPRADAAHAGGPALAISARKALSELARVAPAFLLVVELEETDEVGHANDVRGVVAAVSELDGALREILAFAGERGDTLVIATADHDTGGMALVRGRAAEGFAEVRWASDGHTATWVPLFSFGPGADQFVGVLDNTDIAHRIASLLSL